MEKTLLKEWEKLAQSSLKILLQNNDQPPKFIGCQKLAVGFCQYCRSTGPVDRQRSKIRPLEPPVDRPGRPIIPVSTALQRSTGPVDRTTVLTTCTRLCTSVDWVGRPDLAAVDPQSTDSACQTVSRSENRIKIFL